MLFDKHIDEVTKKVIGTLMFLGRVSANLDKPSRTVVVQALVLSIMNYCIRVWGTTNQAIINNVQKLQNYAAKVATGGTKKFDHVTPIFKELKWMRIKEKYEYDTYTTVFKILNGYHPLWFKTFSTVHDKTSGITRQQNCLYVPKANTDSGARSLENLGPRMWNSFPKK